MSMSELPPFQALLDQHRDDVFRFLVASVGRQEAEDCLQETLLAALRAYPRLRDASNLRAWMLTIAHRKALDVHRGRARRPVPVAEPDHEAAPAHSDGTDGDQWDRVRTLPPRQRAVLTLRYAGELTHAEIATALGCSEEAARRAAADAMKTLRKELSHVTAST